MKSHHPAFLALAAIALFTASGPAAAVTPVTSAAAPAFATGGEPTTSPEPVSSVHRVAFDGLRTVRSLCGKSGAAGERAELTFINADTEPEGDLPRELAFTPDGSTLVIVNRDTDTLTFLDVTQQTITHTVRTQDFPVHVAVTPDGQYAVVPNVFSDTVTVVDIPTHTVAAHVPITGTEPYRVAVTSDSRYAVVGVINDAVNSSFSVIDLQTMDEAFSFPSSSQGVYGGAFWISTGKYTNQFTSFALSPDDVTVVLPYRRSSGAQVNLYDWTTGAVTSLATAALPTAVDISGNAALAVVSHEGSANTITMIDLVTQTISGTCTTSSALSQGVIRLTPDGSHAIAAIQNSVIFVNLTTGATTAIINTGAANDIEISHDGSYAFVSSSTARVIDIASQSVVLALSGGWSEEAATSPVEPCAASLRTIQGDHVNLYDIDGGSGFFEGTVLTGEPPEGDAPRSLAISGDGGTVVSANHLSYNISIIDTATGALTAYVPTGELPGGIALSADGTTAVTANYESDTVSVIDMTTQPSVAELSRPSFPAEVRISPDGGTAYVSNIAGTDQITFIELDGASSHVTGSLLAGQMGSIAISYNVTSGIELSSDGSVLAACISFDDELVLIDTALQTEVRRLAVGDYPLRVSFSPDGARAYVANYFGDSVSVVAVQGGLSFVLATVTGISRPFTVVPDDTGDFVYVGSMGGKPVIHVIDTSTNSVVAMVPLPDAPRTACHSPSDGILYVGMESAEMARLDAAGPASSLIDTMTLSGNPSDMVFSEPTRTAFFAQPSLEGLDMVRNEVVTVGVDIACVPSSGTVPFSTTMTVSLQNLEPARPATKVAARINVQLGGGSLFGNWKAGTLNITHGGSYANIWSQAIPALGTVLGDNVFTLSAEDITPAPFNQPPYLPAGDTDTDDCTVTAAAP
jgi:YVTN family beta-propeller protein